MDNTGNVQGSSGSYHWNTDKPALGKDYIRSDFFEIFSGFSKSFYDTKRVGKIFDIQIPSEFSCGDPVIWDIKICN